MKLVVFRRRRSEDLGVSLLRMVKHLIQGISLHAIKGDLVDYEKFESDMQALSDDLGEEPSASEVLAATRAVLTTMETYNAETEKFVRAQAVELHGVISTLVETVAALSTGGERVTQLQNLVKQLEKAAVIEQIRSIKSRLVECLAAVREETQQLGTRIAAQESLAAELKRGANSFAISFVVDHLPATNSRYGYAAGDEVLRAFSQHLLQRFTAPDLVFRWSGPAFLALVERQGAVEQLRRELHYLISGKLEKTISVSGKPVSLTVTAAWNIFPVFESRSLETLVRNIDNFVISQIGKE